MADVFDVVNQIAFDINSVVGPIVSTPYTVTQAQDAQLFGSVHEVPATIVVPGNILLEEIMNRLEQGKAQIQVEAETYDVACDQVLSNSIDDTDPAVIPQPALLTVVVGNVCTIGGLIQAGDVIGIQLGQYNGASTLVIATDTLNTIAARLAANAVAAGIAVAAAGPVVTVAGNVTAQFTVGTTWNRVREVARRRKVFFATLYAATPYDRSVIGKVLETVYDPGHALVMPDNTRATLVPINGLPMQSYDNDAQQRDTTWSRRVRWVFEFVSTRQIPVTTIVTVNGSFSGSYAFQTSTTDLGFDTGGALDTSGWLDFPYSPPLPFQL